MRYRIGAAVAALMTALFCAPATAAEWWYAGKIADGGFFYADITSLERSDTEAVLGGMLVYPDMEDGLLFFDTDLECSLKEGYYFDLAWFEGEERKTSAFAEMADDELDLALGIACSDRESWAGQGFQAVEKPVEDAFERVDAQ